MQFVVSIGGRRETLGLRSFGTATAAEDSCTWQARSKKLYIERPDKDLATAILCIRV